MSETKIIKVEITEKVCGFNYGVRYYRPGEQVEIPESLFRADFMKRISPIQAEAKATEEKATETAPTTEPPASEPKNEKKGKAKP